MIRRLALVLVAAGVAFVAVGCSATPSRSAAKAPAAAGAQAAGPATSAGSSTPGAETTTSSATSSSASTASAGPHGTASHDKTGAVSPAQGRHHPLPGSYEEQAIVAALRPAIEKDLGQKVDFNVKHLLAQGGFAFGQFQPVTPKGRAIDYSKTRHKSALQQGLFDAGDAPLYALLRYSNGRWRLVTFVLGPTDVVYATWWRDYSAPKAIFPITE